MVPFADARSTVATALSVAFPTWSVYEYPPDQITEQTIALSPRTPTRVNSERWRREILVGAFVRRSAIAEALDLLDGITPTLAQTIDGIAGAIYGGTELPVEVDLAGSTFLVQIHSITIETDN